MKKIIPFTLMCASAGALAEPTVYGKANVSFQYADEEGESGTELKSNASRIGIKGDLDVEGGLTGFYKFEYQTAVDDGSEGSGTFKQRNIFVGLKGNFGSVKAGHFDTPLKLAQKKIDLFNDLEGDIKKVVTDNDNRESNQINYTSPSLSGVVLSASYVSSETDGIDNAVSASVSYDLSGLYLAAAYDKNVEALSSADQETDVVRLVAQYKLGDMQFGALYEDMERDDKSENGFALSFKYSLDKLALKAQAGSSDIVDEGGETLSLGLDYKLAKNLKTFAYYTKKSNDKMEDDSSYLGAGVELKF